MLSCAAQQCLFRAYDIRGARLHFTPDFINNLGAVFAQLYTSHDQQQQQQQQQQQLTPIIPAQKNTIVIGYDARLGSDMIAHRLADILTERGLYVIQLGLITTPMMVFWAERYQGHGIVVTASHSAKDILGIKWLVAHQSPSSAQIQALYQQLVANSKSDPANIQNNIVPLKSSSSPNDSSAQNKPLTDDTEHSHTFTHEQVAAAYIEAIAQVFEQIYPCDKQHPNAHQPPTDKLDLRVVIDCLHGATGHIAQPLFERFCQHIVLLNDTPDGNFPLGNPDPTEPHRLSELQQAVTFHKADIGLAFDGDGDRLMIVDNHGHVVTPDHLLYLLAKIALAQHPKRSPAKSLAPSHILFDIKCAHHLPTLLSKLGATPVISKTGSSLMRQQMKHSDGQIVFAGELSGHFIFNDSRFIIYDDAMYAALRLLHGLAAPSNVHQKIALTDTIQCLPTMVSTADHYLPMPPSDKDCSIVTQLTRLCQYLRQLVAAAETGAEYYLIAPYQPSLCRCSTNRQHMTLEQAKHLLPVGTKLSCIDGVRLDFAHGFGVLRQSNTSHNLTARFAGDSMDDLKDVQAKFAALCRPFDRTLADQITALPAE